jgi:hypothetical protein
VTRSRLPRPGLRWAAAILVLTATLAVSGCAQRTAGAAVIIDDRRITVGELQTASAEIAEIVGNDVGAEQGTVIQWLILGQFSIPLAAKHGVGVSVEQARAEIVASDPEKRVPDPSPITVEAVRAAISLTGLVGLAGTGATDQAKDAFGALTAEARSAHIVLNPRYGELHMELLEPRSLFVAIARQQGAFVPIAEASPAWLATTDS